jgi:plasmid stability protein
VITDSMTVRVPHALYTRLAERARQTQRSIEDELIETLAEAVSPADEPLPTDEAAVLNSLDTMPDDALWQLARTSRLSPAAAILLEELNQKRQCEGLTADEQQIAEALLHQYERAMLVRAEAMAQLTDRGQDITQLLDPVTA